MIGSRHPAPDTPMEGARPRTGEAADYGIEASVQRCPWGTEPPEYRRYHDDEWGRPVTDDRTIYQKLCLEGFQSGLSWLTILRKREAFRRAFAGFDPESVAAFGPEDVERLLGDASIVRHRGKIEAAMANARATLEVREEEGSLAALVWRFEPPAGPAPSAMEELPASTPGSAALSRELRQRGFRFVGPTTAYAAMQSLGLVNDHLGSCGLRAAVEEERAALIRPVV
jgi:DNA-3-methyladenine glycosylase I